MGNGHSTLQLTTCAEAVTRWHLENGLLLNPSKSEALIKGSRHQVQFSTPPQVCVSLDQLSHMSTISDFWELQWIIICRLINTSQMMLGIAIIKYVHYVT